MISIIKSLKLIVYQTEEMEQLNNNDGEDVSNNLQTAVARKIN